MTGTRKRLSGSLEYLLNAPIRKLAHAAIQEELLLTAPDVIPLSYAYELNLFIHGHERSTPFFAVSFSSA